MRAGSKCGKPRAGNLRWLYALAPALSAVIPQVLGRVKHLFDLACDPQAVNERLGPLAAARPGLRVPGAFSGFEISVRAVLGQQVTVKAARTLAGRFAARFGTPLETPFPELNVAFPDHHRIAQADASEIGELGILRSRVRAIQALAQALADGALKLEPMVAVDETIAQLRALPGFGEWTAQYIAMRALAWPDAFPQADFGVLKALGETDPRRALARAEGWRPWRAYAVMHLWSSLNQQAPSPLPASDALPQKRAVLQKQKDVSSAPSSPRGTAASSKTARRPAG